MLRVTFEIIPQGDNEKCREIGILCIGLNNNDNGVGEYTSVMTTDGHNEPVHGVIDIDDHRRRDGAFELVRRCLEAHLTLDGLCVSCGNADPLKRVGIEYPYDHPERYDGVSEWLCACGTRTGRWSGLVLNKDQAEKRP